jgi:hypothetical protein
MFEKINPTIEKREKPKKIAVYHSRYGDTSPMQGKPYEGSDRGKLSGFYDGKRVGFAYLNLPKSWELEPHIVEVLLDSNAICILSLNGEDVPRTDYDGGKNTFESVLFGSKKTQVGENVFKYEGERQYEREAIRSKYAIGPISEIHELYKDTQGLGELVFPAESAEFGKFLMENASD